MEAYNPILTIESLTLLLRRIGIHFLESTSYRIGLLVPNNS